jgi:hypothetical protein
VARSSFGAVGPTSQYKKPVQKGGGTALKIAKIVGLIAVMVVAGFIVSKNLGLFKKDEAPTQEQTLADQGSKSGGGDKGQAQPQGQSQDPAAADPNAAPPPPANTNKPIVAPKYTLDLKWAKIPDCQANGTVSGANFLLANARLDRVDRSHILSLRQGSGPSPDLEIRVYLRLNAGEGITNRTWAVSEETKTGAMTVMKGWKPRAGYAPITKSYNGGYTMKVELGKLGEDNMIDGKIYVALPDTEQTVVAGNFRALYGTAQTVIQQPTETAEPEQQNRGMDARTRQRYGVGR